ncbi:outer membrane beta-barrel protein [Flavobacterium sp. GA093]|uniref:Outer membrane beta-barrel protein n=1 Tax=Flavobacterium hydrocarbonoxydans TaxID=2683249 RepID=A0A6I4NST6_9FLAO|nr:outer membrane beta-barrel protein [Flavobacterium hydrocarbonoxydans]MWB96102.1 outer membrane beta-barrel protein [Flavobacterium hydrocarbonoxydans]
MKKYYITSLFLITAILGVAITTHAQEKKYEISAALGGGASYLDYGTRSGELVPGNGFNAGLRFAYYLNQNISLGIGAEYQSYQSSARFLSLNGRYTTTDIEDESFQFRYAADHVSEKQKLGYINIPVNIQYETLGTTRLYLAAGAKIGFAVSGCSETTMDDVTTSGYYPQYNVVLYEPAFAGFGTFDAINTGKQDLDTEVSYSATFETGIKQILNKKHSLYIGLYLDYGLNTVYDKSNTKNIVQYTNTAVPVQLQYNSILDSAYADDPILLSYGVKLRFAFR